VTTNDGIEDTQPLPTSILWEGFDPERPYEDCSPSTLAMIEDATLTSMSALEDLTDPESEYLKQGFEAVLKAVQREIELKRTCN
jgi:hypothetical protein